MLSFATATFRFVTFLAGPLLLAGSVAQAHDGRPAAKRPGATPAACCGPTAPAAPRQVAPAAGATAPAGPTASVLAAAPAAPQVVQLKGIVLNPDGRPCAGASVYAARAPRQLVVTDAQGAFALPVPAGSALSLRVEYFGEGSSRVEVPVPGAELLHITLGQ